jgi:uncharacterized protein (TIGR03083 family)
MPPLPAELYYAEIDASTAGLAALIDYADPDLPVPTCPGWTLARLAEHVGQVRRRAARIVATRSAEPVDLGAIAESHIPSDANVRCQWLTDGAASLIDALRSAGEAGVWMLGSIQPAGTWARRVANETMVHCADGALAAGEEVSLPAELAADAIDEWLTVLSGQIFGRPDPRAAALPLGSSLHVHVIDADLGAGGEWLVSHDDAGIRVTAGYGEAEVSLSGPAGEVLLVLLGRRRAAEAVVRVVGDAGLLDGWLTGISF